MAPGRFEKMNNTLTLAIIGHLVGDYLLQNDWMALYKKEEGPEGAFRCLIHCVIWMWVVLLFSTWLESPNACLVGTIIFLTHYAQDRTNIVLRWMKLIGQEQFAYGPCAPWSIIVVDNVWHIVTLWAVWRFVV